MQRRRKATERASGCCPGRAPSWSSLRLLPVVAVVAVTGLAVAVVLERHCLAAGLPEGVAVGVLVAGHGVDRLLRLLGRLDPDVAVAADAGTRRDELADDDVLLEAEQG